MQNLFTHIRIQFILIRNKKTLLNIIMNVCVTKKNTYGFNL